MILLFPILVLAWILVPRISEAYPGFISYGYNTCITCHYNGQGNGPLNDYGRALFSTEIAARSVFKEELSEEEIAAKSGFLGSRPLPWWIRPGVKYRGLYFINNPGSAAAVKKYVTMQADLNVAVQFDEKAKYLFVASAGYQPTPTSQQANRDANDKNLISRERYFRWQIEKKLFAYIGLMDKVYGIRTSDHTAYSRAVTGLAQNDQSDGVIVQYYGGPWELTGNVFLGNLVQEEASLRQKGASVMYEYDFAEKNRVGTGFLYSSNDYVEKTRLEVHSKLGLSNKGNSLLTEVGFVKDSSKSNPSNKVGGYLMMEGVYFLTRGYNLLSQIEYYNATLAPETPDLTKWTFGLLMFPMPRMEVRTSFVNGRSINDTTVSKDQWMLQAQLHFSL